LYICVLQQYGGEHKNLIKIDMEKNYNKWYWKVYRWFKWDAKHFHRYVIEGFKNIWRWLPIVWKDRDWDSDYIFNPLKFKIQNTADYIEKNKRFVGWEDEVRYMRICVKLIDRIQNQYYVDEMHQYWETNMRMEPMEDGTRSLEFDDVRNDLTIYLSKYPNDKRRTLKSKRADNVGDSDKSLSILVAFMRHERARKLLFDIIQDRIERWWD
jgi:hypothetical protein